MTSIRKIFLLCVLVLILIINVEGRTRYRGSVGGRGRFSGLSKIGQNIGVGLKALISGDE